MKNNSKADSRVLRVLLVAMALLVLTQPSFATIINVPTDYPSIQAAIVASNSGDTVYVSPGTYVENINFLGKNILLKSTDGAAVTILEQADQNSAI
ncbi:MAG: hypothetical protein IPH59_07905, partial [bacterium]|nr:hypothetical protein [bacterium]